MNDISRETRLEAIALLYFVDIVRDRYGDQVPSKFVVEEAKKMLERELED